MTAVPTDIRQAGPEELAITWADGAETRRGFAAALTIGAAFVALCAWSWGRWTDPQIDYGNELYIAWQLAEGKVLYGDLAHRNGPLSHAWNALLFTLPLVVPLTLLQHHFRRHPHAWVAEQTYLQPYPAELMLRNHV